MRRLLLAALLVLAACSKDDAPVCTDAGAKAFAEPCATDCECASGVCFTFGNGTTVCSLECSSNDECPPGSEGQKCNGQGFCRY